MSLLGVGVGALVLAGVVLLGGRDGDLQPSTEPTPVVLKAPPDFVPSQEREPAATTEKPASASPKSSRGSSESSSRSSSKAEATEPREPKARKDAPASAPAPAVEPQAEEPEEQRPRLVEQLRESLKSTYRVEGDALAVWLVGQDGGKFSAGKQLPTGTYSIKARFKSWDGVVDAGKVQLLPGSTVTITCREALLSCSK